MGEGKWHTDLTDLSVAVVEELDELKERCQFGNWQSRDWETVLLLTP